MSGDLTNAIKLQFSSDIRKMLVGLSWDPNEKEKMMCGDLKPHNLDLSCGVFGSDKKLRDILTPSDSKRDQYKEKIYHMGDNLSGGSDFEDEQILLNFDNFDDGIDAVVFVVSTNDSVKFTDVQNGSIDFLDAQSLEAFSSLDLSELKVPSNFQSASAQYHYLVAVVFKEEDNDWYLKNLRFKLNTLDTEILEKEFNRIIF